MESFKEYLNNYSKPEMVRVTFRNSPSKLGPKMLFESLASIEEGKTKEWGKGYMYRFERRPDYMGGDQIHIWKSKSQAWAYRQTGKKSEPNKYKTPATNIVKNIVSDIFKIEKSNIEEALVLKVSEKEILIEITFF